MFYRIITVVFQENKYFTRMWHPCAIIFPGTYSSVMFLVFFSDSGFPMRLLFLCLSLM